MNFCDRKQVHIELALGMMSDENALARTQIIQKCQMELYQTVQAMVASGTLTPEIFKKVKKPFADTLYQLGVKDCDTYLPSDEEVVAMIQQGQEAQKNREPSAEDKKKLAEANLADVRAKQIQAEVAGEDAESQLDFMSMAAGDPKVYS
jgi:N-acetylmuramic acid 6-phosphate (MurNAc-6-P) etherase